MFVCRPFLAPLRRAVGRPHLRASCSQNLAVAISRLDESHVRPLTGSGEPNNALRRLILWSLPGFACHWRAWRRAIGFCPHLSPLDIEIADEVRMRSSAHPSNRGVMLPHACGGVRKVVVACGGTACDWLASIARHATTCTACNHMLALPRHACGCMACNRMQPTAPERVRCRSSSQQTRKAERENPPRHSFSPRALLQWVPP